MGPFPGLSGFSGTPGEEYSVIAGRVSKIVLLRLAGTSAKKT